MGKSLTATLMGILVKQGVYELEQPAPVPEWQAPGDPRAKIRIVDLLHMSSGLRITAPQDPDYDPAGPYPDHFYIYTGAINAFHYAATRPLQWPPGTVGRYRNCDPVTIELPDPARRREARRRLPDVPAARAVRSLGIRTMVMETDPYGNFLTQGYELRAPRATGRAWATSICTMACGMAGACCPRVRRRSSARWRRRGRPTAARLRRLLLDQWRRPVSRAGGARTSWRAPAASSRSSSPRTISWWRASATSAASPWPARASPAALALLLQAVPEGSRNPRMSDDTPLGVKIGRLAVADPTARRSPADPTRARGPSSRRAPTGWPAPTPTGRDARLLRHDRAAERHRVLRGGDGGVEAAARRRSRCRPGCRPSSGRRSSSWRSRALVVGVDVRGRRPDAPRPGRLRARAGAVGRSAAAGEVARLVEGPDVRRQHRPAEADRRHPARRSWRRSAGSRRLLRHDRRRHGAWSPGPLYHNAPFALSRAPCCSATTSCVMPRFDAAAALQLVERHAHRLDVRRADDDAADLAPARGASA